MAPHLTVVILVKITENNFSRLFTWKRFRAADLKWTEVTHFQGSTGEQEDLSHQLSWPGHSSIQQPFWTKLRFAPFTVIRSPTGHMLLLLQCSNFRFWSPSLVPLFTVLGQNPDPGLQDWFTVGIQLPKPMKTCSCSCGKAWIPFIPVFLQTSCYRSTKITT